MWGICLDGKAWEDGLFQAVVQYKIDNRKALVMSPKANYELDIKKCLQHFMKNLRFFLNLRPSDEGLSYMDSCVKCSSRFVYGEQISLCNHPDLTGVIIGIRWHFNRNCCFYTISINGKTKSKRYFDDLISTI